MKSSNKVHIPGAGDFDIKSIVQLADPCPLPTAESEKRRKLAEKHKLIHAPMSDVGGIIYDKDAVYINVAGNFTRKEGEPQGTLHCSAGLFQDLQYSLQAKESAWLWIYKTPKIPSETPSSTAKFVYSVLHPSQL